MNIKTTLILLALLAVVGLYYVLVESKTDRLDPNAKDPDTTQGEALYEADAFPTEPAEKITVAIKDEPTVTLVKRGDSWWQTEPVQFQMGRWNMTSLVDAFAGLKSTDTIKPGSGDAPKLADIQLDPPAAVVTVTTRLEAKDDAKGDEGKTDAEGELVTHTIRLGKRGAGGDWGYVQKEGEDVVHIVGGDLHRRVLEDGPSGWRERNLEAPKEGKAARLTLTREGQTIEAVKDGDDWSFKSPLAGRVATKAVGDLLTALDAVYVNKFHTDSPKDLSVYGLDNPTTVLSVHRATAKKEDAGSASEGADKKDAAETEEHTLYTLRIGGPADIKGDNFYASYSFGEEASTVVFDISKANAEKFAKKADDLRDARITPLNAADVREAAIERDGKTVMRLTKSPETGWSFAEPGPGFTADQGATGELLRTITGAEAEAYEPGVKPEGDPAATVTLAAVGKTDPDVLKVFSAKPDEDKPDVKRWLVLRNDETTGYLVPDEKLKGVFEPAWHVRQRQALDLKKEDVTQLTLTRSDGQSYTFVYEVPEAKPDAEKKDGDEKSDATPPPAPKGTWKLKGHEKYEKLAFQDLLGRMTRVRAERWLPKDQTPGDGAAVITLEMKNGSPVTIKVHADSRVASASNVDQPFEVSQDVVDLIEGEYFNRTLVDAAVGDFTKVVVSDGGTTLTISRDETGKFAAEDGKTLNDEAVAALFDTLAGLRVERFTKSDAAESKRTLTITLKEGKPEIGAISLGEKAEGPHAGAGEFRFSLAEETFKKLTASLVKEAEKK